MGKEILKLKFYLAQPPQHVKSDLRVIMVSYNSDMVRYRFSTGLSIKEGNWEGKRNEINDKGKEVIIWTNRAKAGAKNSVIINRKLDQFDKACHTVHNESREEDRAFTLREVKEKVNRLVDLAERRTKPKPVKNGVLALIDDFIDSKDTISTKKKYKSLKANLTEFIKTEKMELDFPHVNLPLLDKYQRYLMERYNDNTTYRYIKFFKSYLQYCYIKGLLKNDDFKKFTRESYKVKPSPKTPVTLTVEEFLKVWDTPVNANIQISKDIFLLMCVTGLRISDIRQLKPQHIEKNFIKLETQKDKDAISIPLTEFSREILKRYRRKKLPVFEDMKARNNISDDIKQIIINADIDREVEIRYFLKKKRVKEIKWLSDIIAPHDGRKTFKSIALNLNVNKTFVDAMLGHANSSVDAAYIQVHEKQMYMNLNRAFNRASFEQEVTWGEEIEN